MKYSLALLGVAATAAAQCSPDYSGTFTITPVNATTSSKRGIMRRASPGSTLELNLHGGILKDNMNDVGYIASNYQFQFDKAPQPGSLGSTGFAACTESDGTTRLGLKGSTEFYACIATDYFNFYTKPVRSGCTQIYFSLQGGSSTGGQTSVVGALTDNQPTATGIASSAVGALTDHQPTATAIATSAAVGALTDHQPTATELATSAAVGALTDHQPTATALATSAAVGALTDHQPTATALATSAAVGALTDHQPTATALANATATLSPYTGGAARLGNEFFAIAAGVVAAAML